MNGRHGRRRATLTRPRLGLRWACLVAVVYLLAAGIISAGIMLALHLTAGH